MTRGYFIITCPTEVLRTRRPSQAKPSVRRHTWLYVVSILTAIRWFCTVPDVHTRSRRINHWLFTFTIMAHAFDIRHSEHYCGFPPFMVVLNKFSWLTMSVYACTLAHNPTLSVRGWLLQDLSQIHFIALHELFIRFFVYSSFAIRCNATKPPHSSLFSFIRQSLEWLRIIFVS